MMEGHTVDVLKKHNAALSTTTNFAVKLFQMVRDEDDSIVQFVPDGSAFEVVNPKALETRVLPRYFRHSRFQSLVRQLNFYNFKKISRERSMWIYRHEMFHRDLPELLEGLKRKTNGTAARRKAADKPEKSDDNLRVFGMRRGPPGFTKPSYGVPIVSSSSSPNSFSDDEDRLSSEGSICGEDNFCSSSSSELQLPSSSPSMIGGFPSSPSMEEQRRLLVLQQQQQHHHHQQQQQQHQQLQQQHQQQQIAQLQQMHQLGGGVAVVASSPTMSKKRAMSQEAGMDVVYRTAQRNRGASEDFVTRTVSRDSLSLNGGFTKDEADVADQMHCYQQQQHEQQQQEQQEHESELVHQMAPAPLRRDSPEAVPAACADLTNAEVDEEGADYDDEEEAEDDPRTWTLAREEEEEEPAELLAMLDGETELAKELRAYRAALDPTAEAEEEEEASYYAVVSPHSYEPDVLREVANFAKNFPHLLDARLHSSSLVSTVSE